MDQWEIYRRRHNEKQLRILYKMLLKYNLSRHYVIKCEREEMYDWVRYNIILGDKFHQEFQIELRG